MGKVRLVSFLLVLFLALALALAACARATPAPGPTPKPVAATPTPTPKLPEVVTIATLGVGATNYLESVAISAVGRKITGMEIKVEPTRGAVDWGPWLNKGEVAFALQGIPDPYNAFRGSAEFGYPEAMPNIYQVGTHGPMFFSVWAFEGRGIKTLQDLKGKKIHAALKGIPWYYKAGQPLLEWAGIRLDEVELVGVATTPEYGADLRAGKVDATYNMGLTPLLQQLLAEKVPIFQVNVPREALEYLASKHPWFTVEIPPPGVYGITQLLPTYSTWSGFYASKFAPEAAVYALAKVYYERAGELAEQAPFFYYLYTGKEKTLFRGAGMLPYHPGAIKYYKEIGIWTQELENIQKQLVK